MAVTEDRVNYLCETIRNRIMNRKTIDEATILNFNLLIANLICGKTLTELPEPLKELKETVDGYWFYSAYEDDDLERSFSYVRIFQIIYMLNTYLANIKYESSIKEDAVKFKRQRRLLQSIYDNPGITLKKWCRILKLSPATLKKRIAPLMEKEYIYTYPIGKIITYSLSNKGLELHSLLQ